MLFLGTKKYPNEAEYKTFITSNGGKWNAFTSSENTNFHFSLSNTDKLDEALDRFAQFFMEPLFNKDCVEREMKAIDSEFANNVAVDSRRRYMLLSHVRVFNSQSLFLI